MSDAPSSEAGPPIVVEGEMPREAYGFAPLTRNTALPVVALLVSSALSMVAGLPHYAIGFFAVALLILSPRALWALRMRGVPRGIVHRFSVSAEGLGVRWVRPDGTTDEKHYEWFMFAQHVVEPHRSVLWLRTPSVPGRTRQEVVVLPRTLFGDRWGEACAIVAAHVKAPPVVTVPVQSPWQRWRPLLLWVVLVVALAVVYVVVGER